MYDPNMKFYKYNGWHISEYMMQAIHRYVQFGIRPGDFLYNVLCNNFCEAVFHADRENKCNLPAYAHFLVECMPAESFGSIENVESWINSGGLNGQQNEKLN